MDRIVGRKAPDFKMNTCLGDGSDFSSVSLSDYKGKWLVMFFYPLDFTFVCPTEITGYSKRIEDFKKEGAELLSVSVDSEHSHKAWINSSLGKINFPMASDMTKKVASDYGVLLEDTGVALRGLFIIDPEGVVRYSVIHDLNVGRSVDETLRVLKALKTGGLCPIGWEEGEDLL
ncbi:peroxiredoxin [Tissierella praeacuta]|uniref:peroxiredoxin n=1 Tax=Tissierella praeacuta TaxID=43131 RepID=UPI003342249A